MPYGLFDYIPDSTIHTMGVPAQQFRDNVTGQIVDRSVVESKATFYGGNMTAAQQNAKAQQLAQEISTRYTPYRATEPEPPPIRGSIKTGSTLTSGGGNTMMTGGRTPVPVTPTTLMHPEDPTQIVRPPSSGGGGSCPPGYSPSPSPAPAPVPNPKPPGNPMTLAALCAENPAFCKPPPGAPYTPPGGWGAYNPITRAMIGNEDPKNYSSAELQQAAQQYRSEKLPQRDAEMLAAAQKALGLERPTDMYKGITELTPPGAPYTPPGGGGYTRGSAIFGLKGYERI